MHELRWVWSLALGVAVGCFAEEDPDADDDGGRLDGLDGDTDLDLVFALDGVAFLRIIWIGDGGVPEQGPRLQLEEPAASVAAGDFDGDGDTDVAYAVDNELRLLAIEP